MTLEARDKLGNRSTTATRVKSMIDNHIAGTRLGGRRLSAVRISEVQTWVTERSQTLTPGTVRLVVQTLRSIFNAAVQDRLLARNPVTGLSMPRSEKQRITPLSVVEVQDLAGAMPDRCRAMVITQAGLGRRVAGAPRTGCRLSPVYLRVEFQTTPDGQYRVPPKTPRAGTTSHAPRHHYASVLLATGESMVAVAERLGHENAALVLKTYRHLMPDSEDRTRRAIDDAWTSDGTQTESDHCQKASSLVRGQFSGCGRCWIRTNLAGFWLGAIPRKPPLTRRITAQRYSLLPASFQRVTACRRPGS
jgi:integrase